ncbi:sulfur carrier protein ThiS adenylyltransferase [Desulfohalotomaculum tongense]|uniref:sulfur carrier protein ThiS adenylyltransferase ThiF n=1 Tax=Desulforadius tongensis TaxID=1216062 RepID=UPI0019577F22|nr:sulfur carrier protein ThiS adenylyltransferase [Desulforadius tongensis]
MSSFKEALNKYLGPENLKKIQSVKVGIAGAGGLGSNCAQHLVRSGFSNFVLADFDVVDYSNLNRQFYFSNQVGQLKVLALEANLKQINPGIDVIAVAEKLDQSSIKQVFADCHVVVEAFDDASCKRMLVEAFIYTDKLLVAASGIAGWGKSDDIKVRRVKDNFYIVGDMVSAVREDCPPMSPRVNIVAAKQADVVLSWVLK